uniref:Macaca fascicularis brain cDNA clone: QflA-21901, similar to human EH-domain containing 2 (EHD2), mRNA, RefSeq: NM_014601.2 n=1 Tax=Macaca fascicularis TaxID=9541 RepID=I7GDC2_MACFA|nr:unnamed protein product [Macaca fascicularis]
MQRSILVRWPQAGSLSLCVSSELSAFPATSLHHPGLHITLFVY